MATLTGFEPTLKFSRLCAILPQTCARLRVRGKNVKRVVCTNRAELRSSSVRICPKKIMTLSALSVSCARSDYFCRFSSPLCRSIATGDSENVSPFASGASLPLPLQVLATNSLYCLCSSSATPVCRLICNGIPPRFPLEVRAACLSPCLL